MATTATAASVSLSFSSVDSPKPPIFLKSPHPSSFITPSKSLSLSYATSFPAPYPDPAHSRPKFRTLNSSHSSSSSTLNSVPDDPLPTTQFLTPDDARKKETLQRFQYSGTLTDGKSVLIRPMREVDMEAAISVLTESFSESMSVPSRLVAFMGFLVKQYVKERRSFLPHAVMLVALVKVADDEEVLAGTVEISFNAKGANAPPPTPVPPKDHPYLCNMAVKKELRREVYLHCRIMDKVPLKIYQKAGYEIIKTDSIFILLTFQRRKYLMRKKLPDQPEPSRVLPATSDSNSQLIKEGATPDSGSDYSSLKDQPEPSQVLPVTSDSNSPRIKEGTTHDSL